MTRVRPLTPLTVLVTLLVTVAATLTVTATPARAAPSVVRVSGSQGGWQLTVDGSPFTVKGLTWGPPVGEAAARMPDVRAMGVNTVRTWGTDGTTRPLLDAAAANGVKVVNGFWLQPGGGPGSGGCVDYLTDTTYKQNTLAEFVRWVNEYKEHPGVLMWNVGNESILGMQNCFGGSQLEDQRVAYVRHVNEITRAIHAADPNHPVTSTDAWTGAWPYLKAHAPDLDLYAVNSYGAVCDVRRDWEAGGYTKPYILTEGGPRGEWEVSDDANGVPREPTDVEKRDGYPAAWNCLMSHGGVALGGTLFHYGTEQDFGGVWFNLLPGNERRLSYYSVARTYGGAAPANTPPVISAMSDLGDVPAGGTFTVDVSASDPDGDQVSYALMVNSKYIDNAGALVPASFTGGDPFTVTAPDRLGVWKLYVYARDGRGNVGIESRSFRVVPPSAPGTKLSQDKPTTASSYQAQGDGAPFLPTLATDASLTTRWASDWSDPQWIQVDLGSVQSFDHVQLVWEAAYGRAYEIQSSDDGGSWRTLYSTTTANGGVDAVDVAGSGRYVRVHATQRGTGWGYSLFELGVYRR